MSQRIVKPGRRALIPLLAGVWLLILFEPGLTTQAHLPQTQPDDPLPFGKTIERELTGGEKHYYSFTLEAGQFVQAVVEQDGIDVVVAIFGQDGKKLTE